MNWGPYPGLNYVWGQNGGEPSHTLTTLEMPQHNHTASASSNSPDKSTAADNNWASNTGFQVYGSNPVLAMSPQALMTSGLSIPHQNMSPFLTLNICIALVGIFPTRP